MSQLQGTLRTLRCLALAEKAASQAPGWRVRPGLWGWPGPCRRRHRAEDCGHTGARAPGAEEEEERGGQSWRSREERSDPERAGGLVADRRERHSVWVGGARVTPT